MKFDGPTWRLGVAIAVVGALPLSAPACASASAPLLDADDASIDDGGIASDPAPFTTAAAAGSPLQARIQVNGQHTTCGTCAVLLAQVQGGEPPYTYAWSDPALSGAGPFQVCPDAPARYTLTVTDSSGSSAGEIATTAQQAKATGTIDCVAPTSDAATPIGALVGCMLTSTEESESVDAGLPCEGNVQVSGSAAYFDGGVVASHAGKLPGGLVAGQPYSFSYDRLLPISFGEPVTVDVYGANLPDVCHEEEKLFTMELDGSILSWNKSFCFTPKKDYAYVISNVSIQGVLFYNVASFAGTLCTGCSTE